MKYFILGWLTTIGISTPFEITVKTATREVLVNVLFRINLPKQAQSILLDELRERKGGVWQTLERLEDRKSPNSYAVYHLIKVHLRDTSGDRHLIKIYPNLPRKSKKPARRTLLRDGVKGVGVNRLEIIRILEVIKTSSGSVPEDEINHIFLPVLKEQKSSRELLDVLPKISASKVLTDREKEMYIRKIVDVLKCQ